MTKRRISDIVLLGSGNVATHLGIQLHKAGFNILQVYSRNLKNAATLAEKIQAQPINNLDLIYENGDLYILSVLDTKIDVVAQTPKLNNKFLVHTAGSVPAMVLKPFTADYGVLYPFQTFTKERSVNFSSIPVFIEASKKDAEDELKFVASKLSEHVLMADSDARARLHISAVFACNFTNHMYTLAAELLEESNLPFDLIMPLIQETAAKVTQIAPAKAQTGPAVRFDDTILQKQMQLLNDKPEHEALYRLISKSIQHYKKRHNDK